MSDDLPGDFQESEYETECMEEFSRGTGRHWSEVHTKCCRSALYKRLLISLSVLCGPGSVTLGDYSEVVYNGEHLRYIARQNIFKCPV